MRSLGAFVSHRIARLRRRGMVMQQPGPPAAEVTGSGLGLDDALKVIGGFTPVAGQVGDPLG